ncbi:MAG: hypothetical protein JRC87_01740 [Deltaproteobacteria bacterium]|nr:hypothetical protein [Deltaproteobacteria bacterium]MBW2658312.1 hypothetical protein [Deltaproteobacteria bacterium]
MNSFPGRVWVCRLIVVMSVSIGLLWGSIAEAGCDSEYYQVKEPTATVMLVDTVLVRPLAFIAGVGGAVVWVVSLPFTLLAGNTQEAGDVLVLDAFCYTFKRPLGHMDEGSPPR